MFKKLKDYLISNFSPTTEHDRIIKTYNKGKKNYYFNCIIIITIGNIIIFYLGLKLMEIDLLRLSSTDYLYLILFILIQIYINKNILIPVIGDWNSIENKHKELIETKKDTF